MRQAVGIAVIGAIACGVPKAYAGNSETAGYCAGAGGVAEASAAQLVAGDSLRAMIERQADAPVLSEPQKANTRIVILLASEIARHGKTPAQVGEIVRGVCAGLD